jgi:actin-like ATPase involved in cell morphogenesis
MRGSYGNNNVKKERGHKMAIGADVGTYTLVSCKRNESGDFVFKKEINAFLELPLENRFVFNMMRQAGVPLIEREKLAYALGEAAVNMAYTLPSLELKRPMKDGCVNPKEKDAFQIMSIMLHSLVEPISKDGETLYYCVPANAINQETDAEYHQKVIESIFKSYESETGYKVTPKPINEALALVYAELGSKAFTGVGISCGGGMVNVCFAMYGNPIFQFAIVNSGDWIDRQAAKATGESPTFINKEKMKVDLRKEPETLVERAIITQYRLMIEKTIQGLKNGLASAKQAVKSEHPVDFVVAGGTSMATGFVEIFTETLKQANLSIQVGNVIRPEEPLFSVAKGCLIAAEAADAS